MNDIGLTRCSCERIGLFGGTFNPVHKGHVCAAQDVLNRFRLSRIYFIPSAHPPHKPGTTLATARDRYAMVVLGLADIDALHPCDVEIRRAGPSYSVDTVAYFKKQLGPDGELFFLLGVDAFLEIATWKSYETLLRETAFIVMARPPQAQTEADLYALMASYIKTTLSAGYAFDAVHQVWAHPSRPPIFAAAVSTMDIASSQLREKIGRGQPVQQWLCPAVAQYIKEKGLYR